MIRPLALLFPLLACAGPPERESRAPEPPPPRPAAIIDAGMADPRPAAISEAHARRLVTDRLRRAGLRVLFDVEVELGGRKLTLDGYDPNRRIGFEYTATSERVSNGAPPTTGGEVRILWLEPGDETEVRRKTDAFVAEYLGADAGPG
jgi:hypothetical protein